MVTELKTMQDDSNAAAIGFLEDMLERAKDGEFLSVGICAVMREGKVYEGAAGGRDTVALLGASCLLTDRLKEWVHG